MKIILKVVQMVAFVWIPCGTTSAHPICAISGHRTFHGTRVFASDDFDWNLAKGEQRYVSPNEWIWNDRNGLLWHGSYERDSVIDPAATYQKPWDETAALGPESDLVLVVPSFACMRSVLDVQFRRVENELFLSGTITIPSYFTAKILYPDDMRHEFVNPIEALPPGDYTLSIQTEWKCMDNLFPFGGECLPTSHQETVHFSVVPEPSSSALFALTVAVLGRRRYMAHVPGSTPKGGSESLVATFPVEPHVVTLFINRQALQGR